jgi:hypothetical protein
VRRPRLSYANVVASLALFISLGGGAYALTRVPPGSVGTKQLRNHAVTAKKVARNSLTGVQIKETTLGQVRRATRSDFASSAGFANEAAHAATASQAVMADTATTATKATTASTATKAASATSAGTAASATTAGTAATATNAVKLGGLVASSYLTSDRVLSASVDPVTGAGKAMFTDPGTGAEVLAAPRGIVQIVNTGAAGYLVLTGVTTSAGGVVTGRSTSIAPGAGAQPSGSSVAAFVDLMITHVDTSAATSTRLRLTCSLGSDPHSKVSALSCVGLR